MGFTKAELAACSDRLVPDLIGPGCRLLFVGINPGLWSAATGAHFARPGNRFWPALYRAGITDHVVDASAGMSDADRDEVIGAGVGITNVVERATATAAELDKAELVARILQADGRGKTIIFTRTKRTAAKVAEAQVENKVVVEKTPAERDAESLAKVKAFAEGQGAGILAPPEADSPI